MVQAQQKENNMFKYTTIASEEDEVRFTVLFDENEKPYGASLTVYDYPEKVLWEADNEIWLNETFIPALENKDHSNEDIRDFKKSLVGLSATRKETLQILKEAKRLGWL